MISRKKSPDAAALPASWPRLSAADVGILNRENAKHNKRVAQEPRYPGEDVLALVTRLRQQKKFRGSSERQKLQNELDRKVAELGWGGHDLLVGPEDVDVPKIDIGDLMQSFSARRGKKSKGKGKQRGQWLQNPEIVLQAVEKMVKASGLTPVGMTGPVKRAAQNFLFLTPEKAKWFSKSYQAIIPLAHIWSCSEVTSAGMERIAADTGYLAFCSHENSRGQGVCMVVDGRRFKVLEHFIIDEVANVQGVQDLRPVVVVVLEDTSPDTPEDERIFWAAVHHAKSMRGGVERAGAICFQQNEIIVKHLKDRGMGTIAGDFNVLPGTPVGDRVISVLTDGGFVFVDADDDRATHQMGGRLDLMFTRNLPDDIRIEALLAWFEEMERWLSDHAAVVFAR